MLAAPSFAPTPHTSHSASDALTRPLIELLRELAGVVARLTPSEYVQPCGTEFSNGTIGAHIRHCLDHVRALLDGFQSGPVDYDHRVRGTSIESDPDAAGVEIRRLQRIADELARVDAATPLTVCVMPTRDGAPLQLRSTLGRELSFVLSHTIHHNAMIKGMALQLGVALPHTFGFAPSTLSHREKAQQQCAP